MVHGYMAMHRGTHDTPPIIPHGLITYMYYVELESREPGGWKSGNMSPLSNKQGQGVKVKAGRFDSVLAFFRSVLCSRLLLVVRCFITVTIVLQSYYYALYF